MAHRKVTITRGKGKLRGRHCIKVKLAPGDKHGRSAVRGVKLMPVRFYGCFKSAAKAKAKASKLASAKRI